MTVLFMTNIPSPYRSAFFNELGKLCDLTVTYEGHSATDRHSDWVGEMATTYTAIFLKGIRVKSDQFFCPGICKILRQKFDRIIIGGYSTPTAMLASEFLKRHNIDYWLEADGGFAVEENLFKYRIKHHFISAPKYWLSTGAATTEYLIHYGAKRNNIFRYPFTSIASHRILEQTISNNRKREIRGKLNIVGAYSSAEKVVLAIGQMIPRKGFDILIQALALCPANYHLYIVGGAPTEEFRQLAAALQLDTIHYVGFRAPDEIAEYYRAADLFVLPTREDIWGLVINEAMAEGLPVITTDRCVAGMELVENGVNGYIVPTENPQALAQKIQTILSDDNLRHKMEQASLNGIAPYTIENMAKVHISILSRQE